MLATIQFHGFIHYKDIDDAQMYIPSAHHSSEL